MKKLAMALLVPVCTAAMCIPAYAGSLNSAEAKLYQAASGTYTYGKRLYRAKDSYLAKGYNHLCEDSVDLTEDQVSDYLDMLKSPVYIHLAIKHGYLYQVGTIETDTGNSGTDTSDSGTAGSGTDTSTESGKSSTKSSASAKTDSAESGTSGAANSDTSSESSAATNKSTSADDSSTKESGAQKKSSDSADTSEDKAGSSDLITGSLSGENASSVLKKAEFSEKELSELYILTHLKQIIVGILIVAAATVAAVLARVRKKKNAQ